MRHLTLLLLLLSAPVTAQQWQLIDPMPNARAAFAMSQMHNDTLILIGGRNNSGVISSCDLFCISTQSWQSTDPLSIGRQNMPSVVLADGSVYVPSGLINLTNEMTTTSEVYDRQSRKWTFTTDVLEAREANPAMLLPNGKVLIPAGALAPNGPYRKTCELYDPVTKEQTFTDDITQGQFGDVIFLNPDGKKVTLISDHYNGANGVWVDHTEEYDIATGMWTLVAHATEPHGSWMDQALQLPNGEIVCPSGGSGINTATPLIEIYSPQTRTWRTIGNVLTPRALATTVYLGGDSIMMIGGYSFITGKALDDCEIINLNTGTSRPGPKLNQSRYFHKVHVVRHSDIENPCCDELRIYIFGGENEQGVARSSCEMLLVKSAAESPLTFPPTLSLGGSMCTGIDTSISFKNSGCSSILVDSIKFSGLNAVATGFPVIVKINENGSFPITITSSTGGQVSGTARIYYRSSCARLDTSIAITANFIASTKGTIRPIISDVPNGRDTVEMPLYLVNNTGDLFTAFEIHLGFNKSVLQAIAPRFDGTLAEGAPLADVTSTTTGATIFVPQTISLSVSKPLCILRFVSQLSDTTCTTVRLEAVKLEDASGNTCVYAVRKDSALICKTLDVRDLDARPLCAPYLRDLRFDIGSKAIRFSIDACTNTATASLYDILGKEISQLQVQTSTEVHLAANNLTNGVYCLVVRNPYGASVEKIMINR